LSCAFTPSVLHVVEGAAVSSQLTIFATQSNAALLGSGRAFMALAMIPILGGMFFWRGPRAISKAALLVLLASLMLFSGCQNLTPTTTKPPGQTYTITVTATAWNGISHSVQLQVTVQQ